MQTWSHTCDAIRCEPSDVSGYLIRTSGCLIWHDLTSLIYSREGEKNILYMPFKWKISWEGVFLGRGGGGGGGCIMRKRGLERFWGKCLEQIRVSDNASFTDIQP